VHLVRFERIVEHFALLKELAVPQVDQLLAKVRAHVVAEHFRQAGQQRSLVGRGKHFQRVPVHVDHVNLGHAAFDELGVDVGERAEIGDAGGARFIEQTLDRAEILDPQRHGRMLEQPAHVLFGGRHAMARVFQLRDVLRRHQHAVPAFLVSRQDLALQQDVEAPPAERVVDGLAREVRLARP